MFRRTIARYLRRLLALDDTPERIALAFALGVFLGFSPLLGLHTILGLALAFIFGLSRIAVLLGVYVNNPWTFVPVYAAAAYIGNFLIGFPLHRQPLPLNWRGIWHSGFWEDPVKHLSMLKPVFLGSMVISTVSALVSYPLALYVVRQGKKIHLPHRKAID